ncbi:MAG: 30S ribosomal protein S18 [Patescibacteria group bacterium]|nr:30S ribosomal protein S18 [Patescibacteria group bacterium]
MPGSNRKRKRVKPQPVKKNCPFCKGMNGPDWRDFVSFNGYLSPRSRILPRTVTGLCAKHQRRLAESVKHARHLGLLPFTTRTDNR